MNLSVMGMAMTMKVWASTPTFPSTRPIRQPVANLLKGQMRLDDASVKEFPKIKGFQIASDMNADIMGAKMHTASEVMEIAVKAAPAGRVCALPAGFTKKDKLSMDEIQKR